MPIPADVSASLAADDAEGALRSLEPHRAQLGKDREITVAWLEALEACPTAPGVKDVAHQALDAFGQDATVVIAACAALLARANLRSPDEPPLAQGPAHVAAEAAERCLREASAQLAPEQRAYLWINRANALRAMGPSEDGAAQEAYRHALDLAPDRGAWWFDLGVLHKWRARFDQAFDCMLKARARLGDTRPVLWNLATAATALGQGDVAAKVWRDLGIPAEVSSTTGMPFVDGLPPAQLRVSTRGSGTGGSGVPDEVVGFELVWVAPLSPCHGVVQTPPFRQGLVDFGDVVLWDGAPVAVGDDGTPRFPLLARLRAGDERRWRFVALEQEPGDVRRLGEALSGSVRVFLHHERVEWMCPQCASGDAMRRHEHRPAEEHRIAYGTMVAPASLDLAAFRQAYEEAVRRGGRVAVALPGLYEALGDSKKAGQQHQAWRGIERTMEKRGLRGGPAPS
jgi:tetratricopeptide (TPR) repeat protein